MRRAAAKMPAGPVPKLFPRYTGAENTVATDDEMSGN
jgi:hypothetical protein